MLRETFNGASHTSHTTLTTSCHRGAAYNKAPHLPFTRGIEHHESSLSWHLQCYSIQLAAFVEMHIFYQQRLNALVRASSD
ncbi:hypothetical protein BD309DRAFT_241469 [Dichomitus squalens]|uniref:Uncharacterized protein n=1 Tax=Dichomitus squalens TaxID=114155 RepID=A0A4Q9PBD7_9APHY|nr:hypothetical protein BD311DRAFT_168232 [Dichomitus squalens]TBU50527.1 hypothetical protein BD309DRAFT_241469 [Dichomitus squalens]